MGTFLSYSLQAAVVMTLLYLGYKWLMASTTFHRTNRAALLAIIAISWTLPAILPLFSARPVVDVEFAMPIPVGMVVEEAVAAEPLHTIGWCEILSLIYIGGIGVAAAMTAVGAYRMWRIIRAGVATREEGYTVVVSPLAPGPFSWGRWIVVRPEDCDAEREMVIAHEKAHLERLHWVDLLLAQLTAVLQWFSPAAWLVMHELKSVHEYQADAAACGDEPYKYQMMLLKKTVGASFPTFADSLNHSQIKHRLTMMMKSKTRGSRRWAALAIPAMTLAAAFTLGIPSVKAVISEIGAAELSAVSESKVSEIQADEQISVTEAPSLPTATDIPDPDPMVANSPAIAEMDETVTEEPASDEKGAKLSELAVFVDGKPADAAWKSIDPKTIKSMQIVKDDPTYPNGKILITLLKPGEKPLVSASDNASSGISGVAFTAEHMAEFKGGQEALIKFLADNIKYPKVESGSDEGRVIVQFTIGTDGSVSDARVVRGVQEALDEEALRVVTLSSGQWTPATNDGQPVATRFVLPVTFKKH